MEIKKNLVSFAKDLQNLLNRYPEIMITSDQDGNIIGADLDYYNPETYSLKATLRTVLPTAAEPLPYQN
jgi:hypothetical protein